MVCIALWIHTVGLQTPTLHHPPCTNALRYGNFSFKLLESGANCISSKSGMCRGKTKQWSIHTPKVKYLTQHHLCSHLHFPSLGIPHSAQRQQLLYPSPSPLNCPRIRFSWLPNHQPSLPARGFTSTPHQCEPPHSPLNHHTIFVFF